MDNKYFNSNASSAIMFLNEASISLKDIEPEVSNVLIDLVKTLVDKYDIDHGVLDEMNMIAKYIKENGR